MQKLPRVIASDLDGTLFTDDHRSISPLTMQTLSLFSDAGTEFIPVTGRCEHLTSFDNFPPFRYLVCCNGGIITDTKENKILRAEYLNQEDVLKVLPFFKGTDTIPGFFADRDIVIEQRIIDHLDIYGPRLPVYHQRYLNAGKGIIVPSLEEYASRKDAHIIKINLPGKNLINCPGLADRIKSLDLFDVSSDGLNLEATKKGCSKGSGLLWLLDRLKISPSEAVAFGDAGNDRPLLTRVGWGVAMGNSENSLRDLNLYRTSSNTEDGIAKFLRRTFTLPS
jgi:Cof subfamily protein (haloacid dehalogenase superfamily)